MSRKPHQDREEYFKFTGAQRVSTALASLGGILRGMNADGEVSQQELDQLTLWLSDHQAEQRKSPFSELVPKLSEALADGHVDPEELQDLIWLCDQLTDRGYYFKQTTHDLQILHGMLGGIIADGVISDAELKSLRDWINENDHLRCCWPYDEIDAVLHQVMKDGKVDDEERQMLHAFFDQFTDMFQRRAIDPLYSESTSKASATAVGGVCSIAPEIVFDGRVFCFTGASKRATRDQLANVVRGKGGAFHPRITRDVHFLIVGADGNPCWAFACYGRKVEQAVTLRQQGHPIVLVHEVDFWDAMN